MRIRTENELKEFNAALDRCEGPVWVIGPAGEQYNLKEAGEYSQGISRLLEGESNQFGIFTGCYRDDMVMMDLCYRLAA